MGLLISLIPWYIWFIWGVLMVAFAPYAVMYRSTKKGGKEGKIILSIICSYLGVFVAADNLFKGFRDSDNAFVSLYAQYKNQISLTTGYFMVLMFTLIYIILCKERWDRKVSLITNIKQTYKYIAMAIVIDLYVLILVNI